MSNPLFQALGGNPQANTFHQFQQFMQQMKGQDPQKILNDMVSSGKITQNQLNQAQQQAQRMQGMLEPLRNMFGK